MPQLQSQRHKLNLLFYFNTKSYHRYHVKGARQAFRSSDISFGQLSFQTALNNTIYLLSELQMRIYLTWFSIMIKISQNYQQTIFRGNS